MFAVYMLHDKHKKNDTSKGQNSEEALLSNRAY